MLLNGIKLKYINIKSIFGQADRQNITDTSKHIIEQLFCFPFFQSPLYICMVDLDLYISSYFSRHVTLLLFLPISAMPRPSIAHFLETFRLDSRFTAVRQTCMVIEHSVLPIKANTSPIDALTWQLIIVQVCLRAAQGSGLNGYTPCWRPLS